MSTPRTYSNLRRDGARLRTQRQNARVTLDLLRELNAVCGGSFVAALRATNAPALRQCAQLLGDLRRDARNVLRESDDAGGGQAQ